MSLGVAVFASGGGSNLQALLDRFNGPEPAPARVVLVVSDRDGVPALERARRAGVETRVIPAPGRSEDDVARETLDALEAAGAELAVLAGYVRLVPAAVVARYRGRMLNIHPALLPAFGGKGMYGARVHRAVIEAGCRLSGATVHLVDERYDTGRIVAQWPVPVLPGDTAESLAERVLRVEHLLYPAALEALSRALAAGGEVVEFGGAGPWTFRPDAAEGPTAEDIRQVLGLGVR